MRLLKAFLTALAVMCDAFEFLCLLVEILMKVPNWVPGTFLILLMLTLICYTWVARNREKVFQIILWWN